MVVLYLLDVWRASTRKAFAILILQAGRFTTWWENMQEILDDARLQTTAGIVLLDSSLLVAWHKDECEFRTPASGEFEMNWRKRHSHPLGRLVCWMTFATGSEFLLKGVCLANEIELRKDMKIPSYPQGDLSAWPSQFLANWKSRGVQKITNFGTLGDLTKQAKSKPSALAQLCSKSDASKEKTDLVLASVELLRRSIRNRDVHGYVPNVRESHHEFARLLCGSFNILVQWLPDGPQQVNCWLSEVDDGFINEL